MSEKCLADNLVPRHQIEDLAEEFARRWREGERPSIDEYADRFPQWAAQIRELFPTILMMEEFKPRFNDPIVSSQAPTPPPERLGEYRVIREIGRGGMGVVYEGRHESLGRRVAIKVLPANIFTSEKLRARFRREAQAAARLHHTNIIPVFGVGEQAGLNFYVMQLIEGKSLQEKIRSASTDRRVFDSQTAAKIAAQVADALAYAHSQGVVHRDIKPSNLLLDEKGVVWVADFGVAKMIEGIGDTYMRSNLTVSGELLGTLKYMPPERFLGQSDARGDVYSLGITLYEMLTGQSPFPETTPQQLIQLIHESKRPTPRELNAAIPGDLETIVMKASAGDPAHRYQTAAETADDLRRFLDDRPILARRASLGQQMWRWCRRNRLVAGLAFAAAGLLLLTTIVTTVAYFHTLAASRETTRANERMKSALVAEKEQRHHAEETSASALEALNRIYNRFAPARIVVTPELPAVSSASAKEDGNETSESPINLPPQPLLSPEAVTMLEELLGFYQEVAEESNDYPSLRVQAAEANQRIGDIRQRLGQFDRAVSAYEKAIEMYAPPLDESSNETIRIKTARTYNELGRALIALQRVDEARQAQERAKKTLTEAPEKAASLPEHRYELARTYYFMARRNMPIGPPSPGGPGGPAGFGSRGPRGPDGFGPGGPRRGGRPPEDRFGGPGRRGKDGFGRPGWDGPGGPGRRGPGGPDGPPGRGPGDFGGPRRPDPAESSASVQAINILKDLVRDHPNVPEYRHLLACCFRDAPPSPGERGPHQGPAGQLSKFGPNSEAIELLRQLVKDFPKVPDYRYDLSETLARVGGPGRPLSSDLLSESKKRLDEALALSTALVNEYPTMSQYAASQAQIHDKLGFVFENVGEVEKAEKSRRKAVSLQADLAKKYPDVIVYSYSLAIMQSSLARQLLELGNWKETKLLLEAATSQLETILSKDPKLAGAGFARMMLNRNYRDLAQVLERLGEKELAAQTARKADAPRR
jgi:serine/threonine protein kinase